MNTFKEISPQELNENPFTLIGKDWMLVTAERDGAINTMTASWGGLGTMWQRDVAYVVLRPQRYTKEFVDASDSFSLSFFGEEYRKTLTYLGRVSGRDEDKIAQSGLTPVMKDGVPCFEEARLVLVCRRLFNQAFSPESFVDSSLVGDIYPGGDFHTLYIAEITKVLVRG